MLDLAVIERNFIISEIVKLSDVETDVVCDFQKIRRDVLNNKQGECLVSAMRSAGFRNN